MKKFFLSLLCIIAAIIIITLPEITIEGVREGIKLSLYSVVPSLLPFMILTNIMIKHNLYEYVSYFFKPILTRMFKVSSEGCFVIIIGFLCGYPLGAKTIGDLYSRNMLSHSESKYLITFCNNCSISFLLNYILNQCLNNKLSVACILSLVYLPPICTGILNKFIIRKISISNMHHIDDLQSINPIINTIESLSILSMYIICFTVISNWISKLSFIPLLLRCILSGIIEITSGSYIITNSIYSNTISSFLIILCTLLGGISITLQSFSQLNDATLKKYYLIGKFEQAIFFCVIFLIIKY